MEKISRRVLVLVNPKSGPWRAFESVRRALDRYWDLPGTDLTYQFSQSVEDGVAKAKRALDRGMDSILVMGGDGTVNSIGRVLIGTPMSLGVIPTGSGNGFARHFEIPLSPAQAVKALAGANVKSIDVGAVDGTPFLVTCSMAWDAAIAKGFARLPVRGVLPYVFAGVQEFFEYEAQDIWVSADGEDEVRYALPMLFTIANLSEYGGGAKIAPRAREDDGRLELVVTLRQDTPKLLANIVRLFDGSINRIPEVISRPFRRLHVRRERASPIQIDGELIAAGIELDVQVLPEKLRVLVPGLMNAN